MKAMDISFDRVGLCGFDDFELADMIGPGITVIAQDYRGMGEAAVELLLLRQRSPTRSSGRTFRTTTSSVSVIPTTW